MRVWRSPGGGGLKVDDGAGVPLAGEAAAAGERSRVESGGEACAITPD